MYNMTSGEMCKIEIQPQHVKGEPAYNAMPQSKIYLPYAKSHFSLKFIYLCLSLCIHNFRQKIHQNFPNTKWPGCL